MAAESADAMESAAAPPDLVAGAFGWVVQANYSAADLTRRAAAELEMVVLVAAEGGENAD